MKVKLSIRIVGSDLSYFEQGVAVGAKWADWSNSENADLGFSHTTISGSEGEKKR